MAKCEKCGEELTDEDETENICNSCLESEAYSYCQKCGCRLESYESYLCGDCSGEMENEK